MAYNPAALEPGIYYQDTLLDGTRSELRKNFPKLQRVSFDKSPPVVRTVQIEVTEIYAELLLDESYAVPEQTIKHTKLKELVIQAHMDLIGIPTPSAEAEIPPTAGSDDNADLATEMARFQAEQLFRKPS